MIIQNRVVGNGQMSIFVNGELIAQAREGEPKNVAAWAGDVVTWYCGAYIGSTFVNLCDEAHTECVTTPSTVRTVDNVQEPFTLVMIATFSPPPVYKWLCSNGVCIQDGAGTFDTKALCEAAGCTPPNPGTISLRADFTSRKPGESVVFTAISGLPNGTTINLYQSVAGSDFLVGTGTLSNSRAVIPVSMATEGNHVYYACNPGTLFTCDVTSNLVTIAVSVPGASTTGDYILYVAAIVAGAYIITQAIKGRK